MSVGSSSKGLRASLGSCLSFKLSISLPCDLASTACSMNKRNKQG